MKKRWLIFGFGLPLLVAALGALVFLAEFAYRSHLLAARQSQNSEDRRDALRRITDLYGSRYSDLIAESLRDQDPRVRATAARCLCKIGSDHRMQDSSSIRGESDVLIPSAIQATKDDSVEVRCASMEFLRYTHLDADKVIDALIAGLKDDTVEVRRSAASSLHDLCYQHTYEMKKRLRELIGALGDDDPEVCISLVLILIYLGPDAADAIPALNELIRRRGRERYAASEALGSIGIPNPESVSLLIDIVKNDSSDDCRLEAIRSLGRFGPGGRTALPCLEDALTDKDRHTRRLSAVALGQIGDREAIPFLRKGLTDPDGGVRDACTRALQEIERKR